MVTSIPFVLRYPMLWFLFFLSAGLAYSAIFWHSVPDQMPVHWSVSGLPDVFWPKQAGLLFLPFLSFILSVIVAVLVGCDPYIPSHSGVSKIAIHAAEVLPTAFFFGVHVIVVQSCISKELRLLSGHFLTLFGGLFVGLSIVFRYVEYNVTVGIRTPWTLRNSRVWNDTHRFAFVAFLCSGLILSFAAFFSSTVKAQAYVLLIFGFAPVLSSLAYSFFIRNRQEDGVIPETITIPRMPDKVKFDNAPLLRTGSNITIGDSIPERSCSTV